MHREARRTDDARFTALPGYDFEPHYVDDLADFEGLRMHYIDAGPANAPTYLCLHGEPTWAYLYRKMIPVFVGAGFRVIAPDLFGFGRSDKLTEDSDYSFAFHRDSLVQLIERLQLASVALVVQDWGGILGLTLPMDMPGRIDRLLVMNTALPTGDAALGDGFLAWRAYCRSHPDLAVGRLLQRATPGLTDAEAAAYDAPFLDRRDKAGVRRFPELVPLARNDAGAALCRRAAAWLAEAWSGSAFMAIGAQDPVLGVDVMNALRRQIRGCSEPLVLKDTGHFVPESGDVVAKAALAYFSTTR